MNNEIKLANACGGSIITLQWQPKFGGSLSIAGIANAVLAHQWFAWAMFS